MRLSILKPAPPLGRRQFDKPVVKTTRDKTSNVFQAAIKAFLRCAADCRAATAVEFALVAGPALLTLCAIFQIGLNYYMIATLDHATLAAARAISTGAVSTAGLSMSQFKTQVVCPVLSTSFNCDNVFVDMAVVPYGQYPSPYYTYVASNQSGLIQPPLNSTQDVFCPGAGSQYIVLQVLYPAPFIFSVLTSSTTPTFGGQQVNVLLSSTTFKSEPYTGAVAYQGC